MLGTLPDQIYAFFCNLSKKITDYQPQGSQKDTMDDVGDIDEYGVNVEFDESASEDEERHYIRESDSSDDDQGVEATSHAVLNAKENVSQQDEDDDQEYGTTT